MCALWEAAPAKRIALSTPPSSGGCARGCSLSLSASLLTLTGRRLAKRSVGDAQRPIQQSCSRVRANKQHQSSRRRCSNWPLAVSLSQWRLQAGRSGIHAPTPSGIARKSLRLSLVVVVRLSSACQRRWNKALGSLNLEAVLARQPADMDAVVCALLGAAVQRVAAGFGSPLHRSKTITSASSRRVQGSAAL